MSNDKKEHKRKNTAYRIPKLIGKITLGITLFLLVIILFVRSPWGQGIIVNKLVAYISNKTNTEVAVNKLFITFGGNLQLDGLYLEDTKGDTLIYSKSLEANIPLWSIISGKGIGIDALQWEGVRANITRKDTINGYNFQFLIDALAPSDTTTTASTTEPLNLILGDLNLKTFNVVYNDGVTGIDSHFKIGELHADMEKTNVEAMVFKASDVALSNSNIKFIQKPVPETLDSETAPLPSFAIEHLNISNVSANYQSHIDNINATLDIQDFYTEIPNVNLATSTFNVGAFNLKNSTVVLQTKNKDKIPQTPKNNTQPIDWPDVNFSVDAIALHNNKFSYFTNNAKAKKGHFNPNAMVFKNLNFIANGITLKDKTVNITIEKAAFRETSGINLNTLQLSLNATDNNLKISDLKTGLNNTQLQGNLELNYPKLSALIEAPEKAKVSLSIPSFKLALQDLFLIQPQLKNNDYINTLSKKPLAGNLEANGLLSTINLGGLTANWGDTTQISAQGNITNATQPDSLKFNIPRFFAKTTRTNISKFIDETDLGLRLPQDLKLSGSITGNLKDITTNSKLTTSQGDATVNGYFKNEEAVAFKADISVEKYKLNQLLQNEALGALSLTLNADGNGKTINNLNANFKTNISSFKYNNYSIKDLKVTGDVKDGRGNITSNYKDYNLNVDLNAQVDLDSVMPQVKAEINIKGADLQAIGLMERNIKTGMKINADFKGNANNYKIKANVNEGVMVYDNKAYPIGNIDAAAYVQEDTTSVTIKNKIVDVSVQSNTNPQKLSKSIQRHIASYFYRHTKVPDSLTNSVNLKLRGTISEAPVLSEVFLVNVKDLDTINIAVDFNETQRQLKANITAPHINYGGTELDSLTFAMDTDTDKFDFNLEFNAIDAGPFNMPKTKISGRQANNELALNFSARYKDSQMINADAKISGNRERLKLHVLPKRLIINSSAWSIPTDNEIILTENKLAFNNFKIDKNNQSIEITDTLASIQKDHIAVLFKNFKLSEVLNYLNPERKLAAGVLNGDFILEAPFKDTGILANLDVTQLNVMDVNLGILNIDAKALSDSNYDVNATLREGELDLELKGDYVAKNAGANLDLNLSINKFNMNALKGFSQGEITETDGSFSGNFKLSGTTKAPKYRGQLKFNNADFKLAMFNAAFSLKNEILNIDNKGFSMNKFTVRDENQNTFVLSGNIDTKSFVNPTFNLEATANNFQFLNAKKEDNDFLYGKATLDATAKITGDLQIPKIDVTATMGKNTNVTYIVPSATVNVEERDGIVVFVNRQNPDAILTRTKEKTATIKGYDVTASFKIEKEAITTIIIDEDTGDNFMVSGEGDLNFTMNPNGNMTLAGVFEAQNGHYEMNLYNLVNRRFNVTPGSQVTWSGDPFDAKLDVKALYKVETSASSLMAPVLSDNDPTIKGKFRQVLPFYVYLNIDGQLMAPKINFNLNMPEDEQGAVGGQVFSRVQQLNQQEDELNRQVFSLLVLNRFYPDPGSDGSTGGVASIARNNLNDAISDQLNVFSDKLLGTTGFELDFGLDSYTDYQGATPQERTQLDIAAQKKLFNDRLTVRVGSEIDIQGSNSTNEETPLIGNVSLEYMLTENGRYRIKGFRRNEFENIIDGQTIVSGIALIFTQEFNKFNELWQALLKGQTDEEKQMEAQDDKK